MLIALAAGGCSSVCTANLSYGTHPRQKLDVYQPRDFSRGKAPPRKVVVFFYGGRWQAGAKWEYGFVGRALASQGFVAVVPDYRLYPRVTWPAYCKDGAQAVRWVHENIGRFGGDPDRIFLMGHSSGAHIAVMLAVNKKFLNEVGLHRDIIRGAALLSGPFNFNLQPADRPIFNIARDDARRDPQIEPIDFVDGHEPPLLLLHGARDHTVDVKNALEMADKIRQKGGEVKCIIYTNRGHVGVIAAIAFPLRWLAPVLRDVTTFFNSH